MNEEQTPKTECCANKCCQEKYHFTEYMKDIQWDEPKTLTKRFTSFWNRPRHFTNLDLLVVLLALGWLAKEQFASFAAEVIPYADILLVAGIVIFLTRKR